MSNQRFGVFLMFSAACFIFLLFSVGFIYNGNDEFFKFAISLSMIHWIISGVILQGNKKVLVLSQKNFN